MIFVRSVFNLINNIKYCGLQGENSDLMFVDITKRYFIVDVHGLMAPISLFPFPLAFGH